MATLIWNSSLALGVPAIDDQHGILLDALNELRLALLHGEEARLVRGMITQVNDLMRMHIANEDRLLEEGNFPALAEHRAEHAKLMARLALFNQRYEQRQAGSAFELVEYLRKWFTTHTGVAGKKYGPWLQQTGGRMARVQ